MISDIVLYKNHRIGIDILGVVYCIVNYQQTLETGEPLYWFLTWKDYTSVMICVAVIGSVHLIYSGFVSLSRALKPHMMHSKNDLTAD